MSHFSRVNTQMVNKPYLIEALQDLGYAPRDEPHELRSFGGQVVQVELSVSLKLGAEIGFRKQGETYEIVGDWWGAVGMKEKDFTNQVLQRYAYHASLAKLEEQGFALVSEENQATGQIHLVLRRMA